MINKLVDKDERTAQVENTSYKFGYLFIAFSLLLDIAYRSFFRNEAPWDLFGIIILGGFVTSVYQYQQKVIGKSWVRASWLTVLIAFVLGLVIALVAKIF